MSRDESTGGLSAKIALALSAGSLFSFPACQESAGARLIYSVTDFFRCSSFARHKLQI